MLGRTEQLKLHSHRRDTITNTLGTARTLSDVSPDVKQVRNGLRSERGDRNKSGLAHVMIQLNIVFAFFHILRLRVLHQKSLHTTLKTLSLP
jgi:hypothetical protein